MIKPEDLRIGDYVRVSSGHHTIPQGTTCKVVGIDDALSFPDNNNGCVSLLELDNEEGDTPTGMWCEGICDSISQKTMQGFEVVGSIHDKEWQEKLNLKDE